MNEAYWIDADTGTKLCSLDDICKLYKIQNKYSLYGFTYELVLVLKGKLYYYIGKKNFFSLKEDKSRISKIPREGHIKFKRKKIVDAINNEYTKDGKKVKKVKKYHYEEYEVYKKETDWLKYEGSWARNQPFEVVGKTLLDLSESKRLLTYLEVREQFIRNVIMKEEYINDNILGKFFRGNIKEPDEEEDYSNPDLATNGGYYATSDV